jgi:hypothetical protein
VSSAVPPRLPDFVIIGAQKAASTLLLNSLRDHPEAWLPAAEEPYFRDPVFASRTLEDFAAPYAGRREPRLGLKCPDYLARPEVPARLAGILGDPQLVVCLRDPVARAVSAYFWRIRWGMLPVLPVEEGLRRILDGGLREYDPLADEILEWGLYGRHLERFGEHFAPDRMLVLVDDELRAAPDVTMDRAARFLGITERGVGEVGRRGTNEGVYSPARLRFLQRRSRFVLNWNEDRTFASIPKPDRALPWLASAAVAAVDQLLLARVFDNTRPRLSASLEAELREYYRADVERAEALLGRDLGWNRDADTVGGRSPR